VFADGDDGRAQVVRSGVEEDGVVVELGVGDALRVGEFADVDRALAGFAAVVFGDVETNDVFPVGRSAVELDEADRGAFVLVGVVVLDDAVAATAVEIVGATVDGRGAALVVDEIVLEDDGAGLPGPDAEGPAAGGGAGSAVVVGGAVFDDAAIDAAEDDAVAGVLGVGGIAEIVPDGAVGDAEILVRVARAVAIGSPSSGYFDADGEIVVDVEGGEGDVTKTGPRGRGAGEPGPEFDALAEAGDFEAFEAEEGEFLIVGALHAGADAGAGVGAGAAAGEVEIADDEAGGVVDADGGVGAAVEGGAPGAEAGEFDGLRRRAGVVGIELDGAGKRGAGGEEHAITGAERAGVEVGDVAEGDAGRRNRSAEVIVRCESAGAEESEHDEGGAHAVRRTWDRERRKFGRSGHGRGAADVGVVIARREGWVDEKGLRGRSIRDSPTFGLRRERSWRFPG